MKIINFENALVHSLKNEYIKEAISLNTRAAYQADIRHYQIWGGSLPSSTNVIIDYLTHFAKTLNPSTLRRRLKTIKAWHELQMLPDPTDNIAIDKIMRGIRRVHGRKPKKSPPLELEHLVLMSKYLEARGRDIDARNNALIQIGFFGAFRRSELIRIRHEHLKFTEDGVSIFIPSSKVDQDKQGETIGIPYGNNELCPVTALKKWLEISGIVVGPIFTRTCYNGICFDGAIYDGHVNTILKETAKKCDIPEATLFTGHSFRRGHATCASRKGIPVKSIMKQGRWKSYAVVMGYIDEGKRFTENSAAGLLN